jgi:hypothetical protein
MKVIVLLVCLVATLVTGAQQAAASADLEEVTMCMNNHLYTDIFICTYKYICVYLNLNMHMSINTYVYVCL